jgi:glycerol-3-phosphate dehydrogenase
MSNGNLSDAVLDMLVIGGGIVGAGVARDAAMRGLRVGLVEKSDFASGTSSRSSRLLHGGLRYLAQGRLGLVREASVEKVTIHRIAAHLATPLPFIFPTYSGTDWKLWKLRIGVKLYDWLCSGRNLGKSTSMDTDEVLGMLPSLKADGLTGAVRYFDGLTNDARLVLDTLRSAEAHGAMLSNYAALESARRDGDLWHCRIQDHQAYREIEVVARSIVNAAGAWAPTFPASDVRLRVTKGVHLVIDRDRLPSPDAVVMTEGKRILFAIPWGQRMILGTTDTDYDGPLDTPTCDAEDVRYVLDVVNANFPSASIGEADVISAWAGLRPLVANANGSPSDISRRHEIRMAQPGWFDVTGGKLTTYRLMAEQTVDEVAAYIGKRIGSCTTAEEPLLPDEPQPQFSGILPPPVTREAVEHYCAREWAVHLEDVMIRRTSWRYYHRDHVQIASRVAEWMRELLGWDPPTAERELASYQSMVEAAGARIRSCSAQETSA